MNINEVTGKSCDQILYLLQSPWRQVFLLAINLYENNLLGKGLAYLLWCMFFNKPFRLLFKNKFSDFFHKQSRHKQSETKPSGVGFVSLILSVFLK